MRAHTHTHRAVLSSLLRANIGSKLSKTKFFLYKYSIYKFNNYKTSLCINKSSHAYIQTRVCVCVCLCFQQALCCAASKCNYENKAEIVRVGSQIVKKDYSSALIDETDRWLEWVYAQTTTLNSYSESRQCLQTTSSLLVSSQSQRGGSKLTRSQGTKSVTTIEQRTIKINE